MLKGVVKAIAKGASKASKGTSKGASKGSKTVNNSTPKTNLNSTHDSSEVAKGKTPGK